MLFRQVELEPKRFWRRWSKESSISRFSLMWWNITFGKDELGIYPLVIRDLIISPCQKLRENETEAHGKLDPASRWREKLYSADLFLMRIKNHMAKIRTIANSLNPSISKWFGNLRQKIQNSASINYIKCFYLFETVKSLFPKILIKLSYK